MLSSPLFGGNPQLIADLAIRKTIPTILLFPDIAREGGLLAYGADIQGLYRQAGVMARKVLDGAASGDPGRTADPISAGCESKDKEPWNNSADIDLAARR